MTAAHLSSAELLAWMDGELSWWRRSTVSRHLKGCWECRNRVADLADTIRLAPSFLPAPPPDRTRTARANWNFHERVRLFEAGNDVPAPRRNPHRFAAGFALALAIAAVFAAPLVIQRRAIEGVPLRAPRAAPAARPPRVEPPPAVPGTVRHVPAAVAPVASPLPSRTETAAGAAALNSAEVDVWSILHRSRLCLSGEVSVHRSAGSIEISGVAPTEDRKMQLLALFGTARRPDLLDITLRTVTEMPPAAAGPAMHIGAMPAEAPAEKWLRERMRVGDAATQREMFDVMNAIVGSSQGLLGETWALRRLGARFPVELEHALPEPDRAELRAMAEDHALAIQTRIAGISQMLRPLGISVPARDSEAGSLEWQSAAVTLQQRAAEYAGTLLSLFTAGGQREPREPAAVEAEIGRVAAGLGEMAGLAARERDGLAPTLRSAAPPHR